VLVDRLIADRNPGRQDASFLNGVGAVWSYDVHKSGAGYAASTGDRAATGFLIDRCHVLTNRHVVYAGNGDGGDGDAATDPTLPRRVTFAVGQTSSDKDRGALQGLKFLLPGTVIASGDTLIVDGRVRNPAEDWALLSLQSNVDASIPALTIGVAEPAQLPPHLPLSSAGYPSDHRMRRGDGFKLKDLWRSEGEVVEVVSIAIVPGGSAGALIGTTLQTTPGSSGGPVFGDFGGRPHLVIGIVQSIQGNGLDATESTPNVELLFTAGTLARIAAAAARNPCS
jgi:hypothetical protein